MALLKESAAALRYVMETAEFAALQISAINTGNDSAAGMAEESRRRLLALPDYLRGQFPELKAYEAETAVCRELGFGDEAQLSTHAAYADFLLSVTLPDWQAARDTVDRLQSRIILAHRSSRYGATVVPDERWPDENGRNNIGERGASSYTHIRLGMFGSSTTLCLNFFVKLSDGKFVMVSLKPESHGVNITCRPRYSRGETFYEDIGISDPANILKPWTAGAVGFNDGGRQIPDIWRF